MRSIVHIVSIALFVVLFSLAAAAQKEWKGSYSFDENGGKNAGGIAVLISHELSVFDGAEGGLAASIESNGYQTSRDLMCSAKVEGSKLLIYFESYGENNMFEPYEKGDLLLTLERKLVKGKPVILTYWGKFTPAIERNEKTGKVYFEKIEVPSPKQ